jgi:hypothetical protein
MMRKFLAAGGAVAAITFAAPAMSATVAVVSTNCVSVSDAAGCLFSGNIAPSTIADTQTAYNTFNDTHSSANPDISLNYLFKSDDGAGFPGTVTGSTSGTWSTPGYLVDFLAVKASSGFVLYKLATAASSGSWDTFDIPYNVNPHALSHIAFFGGKDGGGGVPEPSAWAMMLLGMFGMGAALRNRKRAVATA